MQEIFKRNELYWGANFQKYLKDVNVAVFGLGGVGGYALEALCRLGISNFTLVDFDKISHSNINRQIIALNSNVGKFKTEQFEKRLKEINPDVNLRIFNDFYDDELAQDVFSEKFDFVLDAIDTMKSKISLISYCVQNEIALVSSFGAGNCIDASKLHAEKIEDVVPCSVFAKNVIAKLKKNNVLRGFYAVVSDEKPHCMEKIENIEKITKKSGETVEFKKISPASIVTVVAVSGMLMANCVVLQLYEKFNLQNN